MTIKEELASIDAQIEALEARKRELYARSVEAPESEKVCNDSVARMLGEPEWFEPLRYPISVSGLNFRGQLVLGSRRANQLVRVRPCGDEFEKKTFLGVLIGDMAATVGCSYNRDTGVMDVELSAHNPAIWIPSRRCIVFGYESWWGAIESEDDLREITTESIENLWYVRAMKGLLSGEPRE